MNEERLRKQISAADPMLKCVWVGCLPWHEELTAIVADAWGQYQWPWIAEQRRLLATDETRIEQGSKQVGQPVQLSLFGEPP